MRAIAGLVAAASLSPVIATAAPIEGEAALWAAPQARYVIVGETHGTNETPAFFGDLACNAHRSGRPIVVAVEIDQRSQGAVDAFMASDGGAVARARLLEGPDWTQPFKDGRTSHAYFTLLDQLRRCLRSGRIVGVTAMKPYGPASWTANNYETAMAALIRRAGTHQRGALVLVLVGNAHAAKTRSTFNGQVITPAAMNLPPNEAVVLRVATNGETWDCLGPSPSDCGVHPLEGDPPERRAVVLGRNEFPGFDGIVDLGRRATASLPVVP